MPSSEARPTSRPSGGPSLSLSDTRSRRASTSALPRPAVRSAGPRRPAVPSRAGPRRPRTAPERAPWRPVVGIVPKLSDAKLVTLSALPPVGRQLPERKPPRLLRRKVDRTPVVASLVPRAPRHYGPTRSRRSLGRAPQTALGRSGSSPILGDGSSVRASQNSLTPTSSNRTVTSRERASLLGNARGRFSPHSAERLRGRRQFDADICRRRWHQRSWRRL